MRKLWCARSVTNWRRKRMTSVAKSLRMNMASMWSRTPSQRSWRLLQSGCRRRLGPSVASDNLIISCWKRSLNCGVMRGLLVGGPCLMKSFKRRRWSWLHCWIYLLKISKHWMVGATTSVDVSTSVVTLVKVNEHPPTKKLLTLQNSGCQSC